MTVYKYFNRQILFVLFFSLGRGRFDVGPSRGPKWDWGSSRGRHGCPGPTDVRPCRGSNPMALSTCTVQSGSEPAVSGYSTPGRHPRADSQPRYAIHLVLIIKQLFFTFLSKRLGNTLKYMPLYRTIISLGLMDVNDLKFFVDESFIKEKNSDLRKKIVINIV